MKLCEPMMDMDMPDYTETLDSSYSMLELDNLRVLPPNNGEFYWVSEYSGDDLKLDFKEIANV